MNNIINTIIIRKPFAILLFEVFDKFIKRNSGEIAIFDRLIIEDEIKRELVDHDVGLAVGQR